jgi:hypothetical protein
MLILLFYIDSKFVLTISRGFGGVLSIFDLIFRWFYPKKKHKKRPTSTAYRLGGDGGKAR